MVFCQPGNNFPRGGLGELPKRSMWTFSALSNILRMGSVHIQVQNNIHTHRLILAVRSGRVMDPHFSRIATNFKSSHFQKCLSLYSAFSALMTTLRNWSCWQCWWINISLRLAERSLTHYICPTAPNIIGKLSPFRRNVLNKCKYIMLFLPRICHLMGIFRVCQQWKNISWRLTFRLITARPLVNPLLIADPNSFDERYSLIGTGMRYRPGFRHMWRYLQSHSELTHTLEESNNAPWFAPEFRSCSCWASDLPRFLSTCQ